MRRKFIFLVNPIAGTSKKEDVLNYIEMAFSGREETYEIVPTTVHGNYEHLVERITKEKITDVVMVGGDGTVKQVIKALHKSDVNFGIIPSGSGNGLARTAKIPLKTKPAIELLFKGTPQTVDAFTLNDHFSCNLSGLGFDGQVAEMFAEKQSRGLLTYTHQSILHFFKAHPYQFEIYIDGFKFFTEAYFISIANSNQFGNNVTIAPNASLNDGMLDIVIVQKMSKARLPFAILKQIRGNNRLQEIVEDMTNKAVVYFQTPALTIHNLKLAPMHTDGDPRPATHIVEVKIIKDCFRLIQP
jgi:diacylglycerol kinase (ATP)